MRIRIPHLRYMHYSRAGLIFSTVLTTACILLIVFRGFNYGIEFTGGATMELRYPSPVSIAEIRAEVATIYPAATVIQYGSARDVQIRFAEGKGVHSDTLMQRIVSAVQNKHPEVILMGQSRIGGQYQSELVEKGIVALLLSCAGMMIYLGVRFEWKFALGAVLAQLHDVIITATLFSLMQWRFDLTVLAALLAVLGYSVNDTVVVFDRIRENFRKMPAFTPEAVIDHAITQTMARTLVTSLTTMLAVLALLGFGGQTLFGFSVALIIGVVFGTYSSIFVASALAFRMGVTHQDLLPKSREQIDDLP